MARQRSERSWLLEGTRLTEAETLCAKPGFRDRLDPIRDFVQASRRREDDRLEAEKQRQQAELQSAREKQETAERHAAALRKRSRILRAVVAATAVVAVIALVLPFIGPERMLVRPPQRARYPHRVRRPPHACPDCPQQVEHAR